MIPARPGFVLSIAIALSLSNAFSQSGGAAGTHFADANDHASIVIGKRLYAVHCAGCHGRYLQGQPLWQLADAYRGRRAPAFDASGYTWRHSDEEIFRIAKFGRLGPGPATAMPAFEHRLGDNQILAIVTYIKARWPIGLRILQAMRNPGLARMPIDAGNSGWQLPPNCNALLRRGVAGSQSN